MVPLMGERRGTFIVLLFCFYLSFFTSDIAFALPGNWSEVTRFTGSGSEILTTDYFTCDHVEWRIRWEYIPNPQFSNLSSFSAITYPQGEDFWYTNAILKIGTEDTNGTSYVQNGNGTFYLKINVGWTESYIIIVEQDLDSIPEFLSWIILPLFLAVTVSAIVFKKKLFNQQS